MSVDMDFDYFENIPDEVIRRIFCFLPGEDRLNLQLVGNQRIRSLAISMIIDSRSFHSLKIESDVMMLLGYSNLRKIYFPPSLKVPEEWFMSFGRKLSLSCPLIEMFSVHNHAIQLPYYYMINLDERTMNRVESLDITISEKMEEVPFATMIISIINRSNRLSHVSLTSKVKVCREPMDIVIDALRNKNFKSMHISLANDLIYFLQQVHDLEKLSISDSNELDNSYLNGIIELNPRLKFFHVMRYGIFDSFRSLASLRNLEVLIIDLRNPFGLRVNAKEMIESIPSSIKTLMIAFNCMTSSQCLGNLPLQVPSIEKLYFCSRFPRAKRTPNRFREIIDIFTQMTTLKELFVSIETIDDDLEEMIYLRLPKLTRLTMMARGRDEWAGYAEKVSLLNGMS